jgi:16S rRNA (guanine966-N2)-methyltransferase
VKRARGLRVIAGAARGRRLVAPPGEGVRPTKDIAREAVFSALEARGAVAGAEVLDLYAGTGALAIEALSRGAARAVLVERDPAALQAIADNLSTVGFVDRARVVRSDVARFVAARPSLDAPFDLVFIDPPYDVSGDEVTQLLRALLAPGWLTPDAVVVVERPTRHVVVPPSGLVPGWERVFGDTLLTFLWT